jgi:hypothetical protein
MDVLQPGQSTSTDQDSELVEARKAFGEELKANAYRTLLDHISRPLDWIVKRITKGSKTVPFWFSVLILECLILDLGFGVSVAFHEVQGLRTQFLEVGNVLISFLFIILVKSYFDQFKNGFQSDLIEYINSKDSLSRIKKWFTSTTSRKAPILWGALFSIVLTVILVLYVPFLLYQTKGGFLGWGPAVLFLLANFTIGTGGYYLWISRNFRVEAKSLDFEIFEPNPSRSIVIIKLSKLLSIPVTIGAFLSALTTLVFSILGVFSWLILLIVIISGWYPMLSLFVRNHIALARIITKSKEKTLKELQAKISELQSESLKSATGIDYLQKLIEYQDSIEKTPNTALNFRIYLGLFNSLLLPLITFVFGNLDTIINLFSK